MSSMDSDWGDAGQDGEWDERVEDRNPLISEQTDTVNHSPPIQAATHKAKQSLVAKYDGQGAPSVCCRVEVRNGKQVQVTAWKKPSADEYNAIMFHAKKQLVKGGVVGTNVSTATHMAGQSALVPLGEVATPLWKKVAKISAGVAVVGAVGYFGWRMTRGED